MFKVLSEPTFTHAVKVSVPVDGGHQEQSFKATFRVLPLDELRADESEDSQKAMLQRTIVGLDELVDEADQPLTYSDALRDQLIAVPYVRIALARTYVSAVTKARQGN